MAFPSTPDAVPKLPLSREESVELGLVKCLNCRYPLGSATEDRFFAGSVILTLPVTLTCPICAAQRWLKLPEKRHGRQLTEGMGGKSSGSA